MWIGTVEQEQRGSSLKAEPFAVTSEASGLQRTLQDPISGHCVGERGQSDRGKTHPQFQGETRVVPGTRAPRQVVNQLPPGLAAQRRHGQWAVAAGMQRSAFSPLTADT